MPTVDSLLVQIDASTELLRKELQRGTQSVDQFSRQTETRLNAFHNRFTQVMGKFRATFALFGVSFGARAFAGWIESATQLEKLTASEAEKIRGFKTAMNELNAATDELAQTVGVKLAPKLEIAAKFWREFLFPTDQEQIDSELDVINRKLSEKIKSLRERQAQQSETDIGQRHVNRSREIIGSWLGLGDNEEQIKQLEEAIAKLREARDKLLEAVAPPEDLTLKQQKWEDFLASLTVTTNGAQRAVSDVAAERAARMHAMGLASFDFRGASRAIDQAQLQPINPADFISKRPDDMLSMGPVNQAFEKSVQQFERLNKQMEEGRRRATEFSDSFAALFESRGIEALLDGDISGAVRGLVRDFAEMILRLTVLRPLAEKVAGALGGIGKGGGSGAGVIGSLFGFAGGGRPPIGMPSLVGENGPELFVPDTAGRILSNAQSRAALAGAGGVVVQQTINNQYGSGPQYDADLAATAKVAAKAAYDAVMSTLRNRR